MVTIATQVNLELNNAKRALEQAQLVHAMVASVETHAAVEQEKQLVDFLELQATVLN